MTRLQENWDGVSLPGDYTLEERLGDDSAAFFRTSIAPTGRRALVKLIPEAAIDSAAQLDLWQRVRQFRHPSLLELLDCGIAAHNGESALYAVFESPDDTLASALSQSPLNATESREVLDCILSGLRHLHAAGMVHGALNPDNIVAVGDRVKLSTDALRDAQDPSDYSDDIRLLGALWQNALMPALPGSAEIAAHAMEPDPHARWTLDQISAALDPPRPPEPVEAPAPALPDRHTPEPEVASRIPKWPFVAAAAAVLVLVVGLNWPRTGDVAAQPQIASQPRPVEAPVASKTAAPSVAVRAEPKPSPANSSEVWRVIAFTYRTRDAAARKVKQLNQLHPGLDATVFSPDGRGYHLVSLGGRMTHEDAVRLQRNARGKGLPRDLYVQNYSR